MIKGKKNMIENCCEAYGLGRALYMLEYEQYIDDVKKEFIEMYIDYESLGMDFIQITGGDFENGCYVWFDEEK